MVATKGFKYPDQELYDWVLNELHKRNINNHTVGEIAYEMQHQYLPELTVEDFGKELDEVLKKREVLNILATGFALDNLANEGLLPEPLQTIVKEDAGVYGVDETISLALSQLYGSIAVTNYGYEDKKKLGIAAKLDNSNGQVNTFADDLALALASAVIGRCGHGSKLELKNDTHNDSINIDNALYQYPEYSDDLEEADDKDTASSIENSIQHIAQELESVVKQATGDQDIFPKDNPLDKLLQIMLLVGDVWGNQENLNSNNRKDNANE